MNNERKQQGQQEPQEPVSLAELSRQYLHGNMGLEEYLAMERRLTPGFGELAGAMEVKVESMKQSIQNQPATDLTDINKNSSTRGEQNWK